MRLLSGLFICLFPLWAVATEQPVAIALHGGAGTIERDRMSAEVEAEYGRDGAEKSANGVKRGHLKDHQLAQKEGENLI